MGCWSGRDLARQMPISGNGNLTRRFASCSCWPAGGNICANNYKALTLRATGRSEEARKEGFVTTGQLAKDSSTHPGSIIRRQTRPSLRPGNVCDLGPRFFGAHNWGSRARSALSHAASSVTPRDSKHNFFSSERIIKDAQPKALGNFNGHPVIITDSIGTAGQRVASQPRPSVRKNHKRGFAVENPFQVGAGLHLSCLKATHRKKTLPSRDQTGSENEPGRNRTDGFGRTLRQYPFVPKPRLGRGFFINNSNGQFAFLSRNRIGVHEEVTRGGDSRKTGTVT